LSQTLAQGRSEQSGPRGRTDQRETFQIKLDRPRRRTLADHDVYLIILHLRIKHFLDYVIEPVNLVDEEHVAFIEIGEQSGEVAGALDDRPRGRPDVDAHIAREDVGERCFPQTGRTMEQDVIQYVVAAAGRGDRDLEVFFDL